MKRFLAIMLTAALLLSLAPMTASMAISEYATVVGGWLRMRNQPNFQANTVDSFYTGTQVKILGSSGSWYNVQVPDGRTGYMYGDYLSFSGGGGGGKGTATVTSHNGYGVRLRSGPGTGYRILRVYSVGTVATVLQQGSYWTKLNVGGTVGYMMNQFLNFGGGGGGGDKVICYATIWSRNGYGVRLRTGPGSGYGKIGVYSVGTSVAVLEKGTAWDKIRVGSRVGWMMNEFLSYYATTEVTSVAINNPNPVVDNVLEMRGLTPTQATVNYSWIVGGVEKGITPTYTVTMDDVGKKIQLKVTGTGNYTGSATSVETNAVVANTEITKVELNTVTPAVGDTVRATLTPSNATALFTWLVDGKQVSVEETYQVKEADVGKKIQMRAVGIGVFTGTKLSLETAPVSKTGKVKSVVIYNQTSRTNANVVAPNVSDVLYAVMDPAAATVEYQWWVNNVLVGTNPSITVRQEWKGATIGLSVTGVGNYANTSAQDVSVPVTQLQTVTDLTIQGVTPPAVGAQPVNKVQDSNQFVGTVQWSPNDPTFQSGKTYTATIVLSPNSGYTFAGVGENAFKVAGATAKNSAGGSTVIAEFKALPNAAPVITTDKLNGGTTGVAYSAKLEAIGTAPIQWSIDGKLPDGLKLTGDTISGTPTVAGTFSFKAVAVNGTLPNAAKNLSIVVSATATPPTITTTALAGGTVGAAYTATLSATGTQPITWSKISGDLPGGLALTNDGTITGTPMADGTFSFKVQASNAAGSVEQTLSIAIVSTATPPIITTTALAGGTVGAAYTATLTATGTQPITWSKISGDLPGGLTLANDGTITGTPTADGTFSFKVQASNAAGSVEQTLSIAIVSTATPPIITTTALAGGTVGAAYTATLTATGTQPITWSKISGDLPGGLTLANDGTITGTPTADGTFSFKVQASNAAGSVEQTLSIAIVAAATPPTITTTALAGGTVGTAYTAALSATGTQPITWSKISGDLPGGLALMNDGTITGTPMADGTFSFKVQASNAAGSVEQTLSIAIVAAATPPTITTASLSNGKEGDVYNAQLAATGNTGSITWSITSGTLPSGLTLGGDTISGTPDAGSAGSHSLSITATDSATALTATANLTLTIDSATP